MTEITREDLTTLAESDDVKMRATGVIGGWIWDNYGPPAPDGDDGGPVAAAKDLISTMTGAGLWTFMADGLAAHVESLQAEAYERGCQDGGRVERDRLIETASGGPGGGNGAASVSAHSTTHGQGGGGGAYRAPGGGWASGGQAG